MSELEKDIEGIEDPSVSDTEPKKAPKKKKKDKPTVIKKTYTKRDGTEGTKFYNLKGEEVTPWGAPILSDAERKAKNGEDFQKIVAASRDAFFNDNPDAVGVNGRLCAVSPEDETMRAIMQRSTYESLMFFNASRDLGAVKNDDELCNRLNDFFMACAYSGQFITIEKMCLALGVNMSWYKAILSGSTSAKPFSSETRSILEQARLIIQAIDADLVSTGKIQQVSYIFRAKNFYDMSDDAKVNLTVAPAERTTQQLLYGADSLPDEDN